MTKRNPLVFERNQSDGIFPGVVTPVLICPVSDTHMMIRDTAASDAAIAPLLECGIKVRGV
jgi:hypothetical protein